MTETRTVKRFHIAKTFHTWSNCDIVTNKIINHFLNNHAIIFICNLAYLRSLFFIIKSSCILLRQYFVLYIFFDNLLHKDANKMYFDILYTIIYTHRPLY